jgi:uncharacterized membrane protein YedE/YeeE
MKNLIAIISGLIFGIGLAASGMTDTTKVQGFLDIFGDWDGSLLFVLGGALGTTLLTFRILLKRKAPLFAERFLLPIKTTIDKPLVIGAMIFGVGWALVGYCPGPAFAALAYLQWQTLLFVATMLAGAFVARKWSNRGI